MSNIGKPSRWLVVGGVLCVIVFALSVPAFHTMWLAGTCGKTKFLGCATHSTGWMWGWAVVGAGFAVIWLVACLILLREFLAEWAEAPARQWLTGIVLAGVTGVGTVVTYHQYARMFVYRVGPAPFLFMPSVWYTSVVTAFGGGFGLLFFLVCVGTIPCRRADGSRF